MKCPVCGFDNLTGTEVCDNCGADLADVLNGGETWTVE